MRTLTITRHKSFVGCAVKDKVYIEDPQAPELTINGVPCRKLGDLKNGATVTFEIDEAQRKIFLIVDKLSKEYCNASVTIPAGEESVSFSGKHHFVFGSNPFRFDGVELTEEEKKQQKKNGNKGLVIMIVAVCVGLLIGKVAGNWIGGSLVGDNISAAEADTKTFVKGDFSITLTEAFKETEMEGFFVGYESRQAVVFAIREDKQGLEITLEEYAEMVLANNNRENLAQNRRGDYIWFEYTANVDGQELYYLAACYCAEDACWVVNFATPVKNSDEYKESFLTWADSAILEGAV